MRQGDVLKYYLDRPVLFGEGYRRVRYPAHIDLKAPLADYVRQGGFTSEPLPFESLHRRVPREQQAWGRDAQMQGVNSDEIASRTPALMKAYHQLVKFLAEEVLGFDVMFEEPPNIRFHFPGGLTDGNPDRYRSKDGQLLAHHSDTLFGDPFEQINCWLPLGKCYGSNALQWAPMDVSIEILHDFCRGISYSEELFVTEGRPRFFNMLNEDLRFREKVLKHCVPLEAEYGEIILFDPRMIHGTAENFDDHTRVSSDFRLLPVKDFEAMATKGMSALSPLPTDWARDLYLEKVEFYNRRTAFQL